MQRMDRMTAHFQHIPRQQQILRNSNEFNETSPHPVGHFQGTMIHCGL